MKAFAVIPCTCSPASVVITVTPVANMPSVLRNSTDESESGPEPLSSSSGSGTSSNGDSIPSVEPGRAAILTEMSNSSGSCMRRF